LKKIEAGRIQDLTGKPIIKETFELTNVSVKEMQQLLNNFGEASAGKKAIFKNLDIAAERRPYRMLFGSLKDDLDNAANYADELKIARSVWKKYSDSLNALEESAIGKFLGKGTISGEQAFKRFMALQPSEMTTAFKLVQKTNPNLARTFQADAVSELMALARQPGAKMVPAFSPRKMFDLVRDDARFKAIFNDAKARQGVRNMIEVTRLLMSSPPEMAHAGWMPAIKQAVGVLASRDKTFEARMAGDITIPRLLARAMFTDEGMKALELLRQPYNPARVGAVTGQLYAAIMNNYREE